MVSSAKVFIAGCLLFAFSMQMCSSSAIPIWEFLTRNEKISYLYSTFAQLVSLHCKATVSSSTLPVNQCKHNLLSYGYEKLQTFSNAQLESLDPYQHGANELIWASIMRDHSSATLVTTRKPLPTPPASSIIILTHQQPTASVKNPLFEGNSNSNAEQQHKLAMDMDAAYGYTQSQILDASGSSTEQKTYLTGPLVIRVRPDGTPVEEDRYRPLPRDDDNLEVFQVSTLASKTASRAKHHKIATINVLKQQQQQQQQQQFAAIALQRDLLPPAVEQRRQFRQVISSSSSSNPGYFYGQSQA